MSRYQRSMRDALQSVADGQMEFDEAVKWEVKIGGLPTFYADGKSKGDVRRTLRKLLKRPDEIVSIERVTPSELKKIRRAQISGDEPGDEEGEVKEELLVEDNRATKVQNKELSIDDIVNMIQFGHPFTVVDEDIPATLPPGDPNFPRYKDIPNSVVDKEDKKANKVKAKAEKDTLVPTETQEGIVSGAGKVAGAAIGGALALGVNPALGIATGAGVIKGTDAIQKNLDKRKAARKAEKEKKDVRLSRDAKVKKENYEMWFEASEWAKSKELERQDSERLARQQAERERRALTRAVANSPKQQALARAQAKDKNNQNKDPVGKQHEATFKHPDAGVPLSVRRARKKKSAAQMKIDMRHADQVSKIGQGRRKEQQLGNVGVRPTPKWYHSEETEIDEWGNSILDKQMARHLGRPQTPKPDEKPKSDTWSKNFKKQSNKRVGDMKRRQQAQSDSPGQRVEVAPPGWGHTVAKKEKSKPNKPKSKIGGSAHEFDKDLKSGKFKGLPGDKTMKDKKASMFKLMWSMKNKGDKPHYKPGVKDKLKTEYKKDESVLDTAKRYLVR